jgi:SAM-dependent methyltransferase
MVIMSHDWQSLWDETIKRSSFNRRLVSISERERINLLADSYYKAFDSKQNQDDLQKMPKLEIELSRLMRFITKDSSVLDIGAGFGRVAIPLSKEVRKMTVIEPASICMKLMRDRAARERVDNMEFIECLWSDFPIRGKYDLVYSTLSPAISDPEALLKMHKASRGYCALELGASPSKDLDFADQIYPMVTGEVFRSSGNYLNIITTLYDYGIYANLETWVVDSEIKYQTVEDIVELRKTTLKTYIKVTSDMEDKLHQFYQSKANPDGTYTIHVKGVACMIWWHV